MEGGEGDERRENMRVTLTPYSPCLRGDLFYTSPFRTGFNNSSSLDVFSASVDGGRFRRSGYDHLRSFFGIVQHDIFTKMTLGEMHCYCPV